jgi:hypothetical protein
MIAIETCVSRRRNYDIACKLLSSIETFCCCVSRSRNCETACKLHEVSFLQLHVQAIEFKGSLALISHCSCSKAVWLLLVTFPACFCDHPVTLSQCGQSTLLPCCMLIAVRFLIFSHQYIIGRSLIYFTNWLDYKFWLIKVHVPDVKAIVNF